MVFGRKKKGKEVKKAKNVEKECVKQESKNQNGASSGRGLGNTPWKLARNPNTNSMYFKNTETGAFATECPAECKVDHDALQAVNKKLSEHSAVMVSDGIKYFLDETAFRKVCVMCECEFYSCVTTTIYDNLLLRHSNSDNFYIKSLCQMITSSDYNDPDHLYTLAKLGEALVVKDSPKFEEETPKDDHAESDFSDLENSCGAQQRLDKSRKPRKRVRNLFRNESFSVTEDEAEVIPQKSERTLEKQDESRRRTRSDFRKNNSRDRKVSTPESEPESEHESESEPESDPYSESEPVVVIPDVSRPPNKNDPALQIDQPNEGGDGEPESWLSWASSGLTKLRDSGLALRDTVFGDETEPEVSAGERRPRRLRSQRNEQTAIQGESKHPRDHTRRVPGDIPEQTTRIIPWDISESPGTSSRTPRKQSPGKSSRTPRKKSPGTSSSRVVRNFSKSPRNRRESRRARRLTVDPKEIPRERRHPK
eukprot:363518_1